MEAGLFTPDTIPEDNGNRREKHGYIRCIRSAWAV